MIESNKYKNWLYLAYVEASHSPDESSQNGALLIGRTGIAKAHNKPSPGIDLADIPSDFNGNKYVYMEHAERGAIYSAAANGISTRGATLICPWAACYDCARAIVAAGITKLVRHANASALTTERWAESVFFGDVLMEAAGVEIIEYDGKIGAPSVRFDKQVWNP